MGNDKIKSLYDTFVNEGYEMESESEFRKNLSDRAKRRAAYDALVNDGYEMEPYEEFERNLGFGASASSRDQAKPTNGGKRSIISKAREVERLAPGETPDLSRPKTTKVNAAKPTATATAKTAQPTAQTNQTAQPTARTNQAARTAQATLQPTATDPLAPVDTEGMADQLMGGFNARMEAMGMPAYVEPATPDPLAPVDTEGMAPLDADAQRHVDEFKAGLNTMRDNVLKGKVDRMGMAFDKDKGHFTTVHYDKQGKAHQSAVSASFENTSAKDVVDYSVAKTAGGVIDAAAKRHLANTERIYGETSNVSKWNMETPASQQARFMQARAQSEMSRMTEFDMETMIEDAWRSLPDYSREAIVASAKEEYREKFPTATDEQLDNVAQAAGRSYVAQKVYEEAVRRNMPKDNLDFLFRKIGDANLINSISVGLARIATGKSGDQGAYEAAMQAYGQEHRVMDSLGMVAGFMLDLPTYGAGWIGGAVGKKAIGWLGKRAVKGVAGKAAVNAGTRQVSNRQQGRVLSHVAGSGANFGSFEAEKEFETQLKHGGRTATEDDDQMTQILGYKSGEYSALDVGKQLGHGLLMGSAIGTLGPWMGNVADKWVRATSSTAGKIATRTGMYATSKVLEGTIFSVPEWIEGKRDWFDVWLDNMIMVGSFAASHPVSGMVKGGLRGGAKGAAKGGFGAIYDVIAKSEDKRSTMHQRLRSYLDMERGGAMALTKDEREELAEYGYDLKDMVAEVDKDGMVRVSDKRTTESNLKKLMDDKRVSESAKAKMHFYATGRMAAPSTIVRGDIAEVENGRFVVRSYGAGDGVVTRRTFKYRKGAEAELRRIETQARLNEFDRLESERARQVMEDGLTRACRSVAEEHGWDTEYVVENYVKGVTDEPAEQSVADFRQSIVELVSGRMDVDAEGATKQVEEKRKEINERHGVDIDKLLGNESHSEKERKALDEYRDWLRNSERESLETDPENTSGESLFAGSGNEVSLAERTIVTDRNGERVARGDTVLVPTEDGGLRRGVVQWINDETGGVSVSWDGDGGVEEYPAESVRNMEKYVPEAPVSVEEKTMPVAGRDSKGEVVRVGDRVSATMGGEPRQGTVIDRNPMYTIIRWDGGHAMAHREEELLGMERTGVDEGFLEKRASGERQEARVPEEADGLTNGQVDKLGEEAAEEAAAPTAPTTPAAPATQEPRPQPEERASEGGKYDRPGELRFTSKRGGREIQDGAMLTGLRITEENYLEEGATRDDIGKYEVIHGGEAKLMSEAEIDALNAEYIPEESKTVTDRNGAELNVGDRVRLGDEVVTVEGFDEDGGFLVYRRDGEESQSFLKMEKYGHLVEKVGEETAAAAPMNQEARQREEADGLTNGQVDKLGEEAAEVATEAAEEQPEAERTPLQRVPRDEKDEPVFEAVDHETAWDALVEFSDGDPATAMEIAEGMLEEKKGALEKARKQKAKGKTPTEILASKKANAAELARAEQEYEHWSKMVGVEASREEAIRLQMETEAREQRERAEAEKAEREAALRAAEEEAARKAAEEEAALKEAEKEWKKKKAKMAKRKRETAEIVRDCPEALEILMDEEPHTLLEVAAYVLSYTKLLATDDGRRRGFKSMTGYGRGEFKKMIGLFAKPENGGQSIERVAEDSMKEICNQNGVPYDNYEAVSAILDLLSQCSTYGEIRNYIANNRIEHAMSVYNEYQRMMEDDMEYYRYMEAQHYGMTVEEYDDYQDCIEEYIKYLDEGFDGTEFYSIIADEIAARSVQLREKEIPNEEGNRPPTDRGVGGNKEDGTPGAERLSGVGTEVLSESLSDKQRGADSNGARPGLQTEDGIDGGDAQVSVAPEVGLPGRVSAPDKESSAQPAESKGAPALQSSVETAAAEETTQTARTTRTTQEATNEENGKDKQGEGRATERPDGGEEPRLRLEEGEESSEPRFSVGDEAAQTNQNERNGNEGREEAARQGGRERRVGLRREGTERMPQGCVDLLDTVGRQLGLEVRFAPHSELGGANAMVQGGVVTLSERLMPDGGKDDAAKMSHFLKTAFGHEVTHELVKQSREHREMWEALRDAAREVLGAEAFDAAVERVQKRYDEKYDSPEFQAKHGKLRKLTREEVEEEVVVDSCGELLMTNQTAMKRLVDKVSASGEDGRSVAQRVLGWIDSMMDKLRSLWGGKPTGEQQQAMSALEAMRKTWEGMYEYAAAKERERVKRNLDVNGGDQTRFNLFTYNEDHYLDEKELKGMLAKRGYASDFERLRRLRGKALNDELKKMGFSGKEAGALQKSGRKMLEEAMRKNGKDEREIRRVLKQMDHMAKFAKALGSDYGEFNFWQSKEPVIGDDGTIHITCVVRNSEYPMNIDFSIVCKKKEAATALLDYLMHEGDESIVKDGKLTLTKENLRTLNNIVNQHGFEMACDLCFVEAKRFNVSNWARSFADFWNPLVRAAMVARMKAEGKLPPDYKTEDFTMGEFNFRGSSETMTAQDETVDVSEQISRLMLEAMNEYVKEHPSEMRTEVAPLFERVRGADGKWETDRSRIFTRRRPIDPDSGEVVKNRWEKVYLQLKEDGSGFIETGETEPMPSSGDASRESFYEKVKIKGGGKAYADKPIVGKMMELLSDPVRGKRARKFISAADLVSPGGMDALINGFHDLYKIVNMHGGVSKPKSQHGHSPYVSAALTGSSGVPFSKEKAFHIGGVRNQSFSDYEAKMFFDYMQMYADMAALGMPMQAYTKEPAYVRLFGQTGAKINMSLLCQTYIATEDLARKLYLKNKAGKKSMTRLQRKVYSYLADHCGLRPVGGKALEAFRMIKGMEQSIAEMTNRDIVDGKMLELERLLDEIEKNDDLENEWDYNWGDQTFPAREAFDIIADPAYNKNVGTILVVTSDGMMRKALKDPRIEMAIPYHKSGIPTEVALSSGVFLYKDYTPTQTDRNISKKGDTKATKLNYYDCIRMVESRLKGESADGIKAFSPKSRNAYHDPEAYRTKAEAILDRLLSQGDYTLDDVPSLAAKMFAWNAVMSDHIKPRFADWVFEHDGSGIGIDKKSSRPELTGVVLDADGFPKFGPYADEYFKKIEDFSMLSTEEKDGNVSHRYRPQQSVEFRIPDRIKVRGEGWSTVAIGADDSNVNVVRGDKTQKARLGDLIDSNGEMGLDDYLAAHVDRWENTHGKLKDSLADMASDAYRMKWMEEDLLKRYPELASDGSFGSALSRWSRGGGGLVFSDKASIERAKHAVDLVMSEAVSSSKKSSARFSNYPTVESVFERLGDGEPRFSLSENEDARSSEERKRFGEAMTELLRDTGIEVVTDKAVFEEELEKATGNHEALQAMTGYHGSPHSFEAFDHSKMGSGEGAQVHGWGTYVTLNKTRATRYGELERRRQWLSSPEFRAQQRLEDEMNAIYSRFHANKQKFGEGDEERLREIEQERTELEAAFRDRVGANLYDVEIPDDNGHNYLTEGSNIPKAHRRRIADVVRTLDEAELQRDKHGPNWLRGGLETLAKVIEREQHDAEELRVRLVDAFGSERRASEIMAQAGFVGIKYNGGVDGPCAVIFKEGDAEVKNRTQLLKTSKGEVYGFVKDGKVYLDPDVMNPNTPVHEYTHLWDHAIQGAKPELWKRGKELMKQLPLWREVTEDANYADIAGNEDLVASEVHSRLSGETGEKYLDEMVARAKDKGVIATAEAVTLKERIKQWMKDVFGWVRDAFGGKWDKEAIDKLTVEEFAAMPVRDLAKGFNPLDADPSNVGEPRFSFMGERGAEKADRATETTLRMDNLKVAEEMERSFKETEGTEEHQRMVEAAKKVRELKAYSLDKFPSNKDQKANEAIISSLENGKNEIDGREVRWVKNSVGKMMRHKGFDQTRLIPQLKILFDGSVPIISEKEHAKEGHKDHSSNFVGYHHYVNKVSLEGKNYYVRFTVQEGRTKKRGYVPNEMHSSHVTDVGIYDTDGTVLSGNDPATNSVGAKVDAKLQQFFVLASSDGKENARRIKMATGWERGADGKWRYELAEGEPKADILEQMKMESEEVDDVSSWEGKLGEALDGYEELLSAYPDLADIDVQLFWSPEHEGSPSGFYIEGLNQIRVMAYDGGEMRSALAHEVQHAIQAREGFARGGLDSNPDYHRLGGEVESRNVQTRLGMTEEERGRTLAEETEDVSRAEQVLISQGDGTSLFIGKRARAQYEELLRKKRPDLPEQERNDALDYLHSLEDTKENNRKVKVAVHWMTKGANLPNDMHTIDRAIAVADKAKVDPMGYASPQELLAKHADVKLKEKPINPDDVPTLRRSKFENDHGVAVYDVEDSEESRQWLRRIINTHWGEDANPWCLLQGDGKGNLTEESADYWSHYDSIPKQVAFKDGKLLSFRATNEKSYRTVERLLGQLEDEGFDVENVDYSPNEYCYILDSMPESEVVKYGEEFGMEYEPERYDGFDGYKEVVKEEMCIYFDERLKEMNAEYEDYDNIPTWWDRQDSSHKGVPIIAPYPGIEGAVASYELSRSGELGEASDIHRGNKQNGVWESYYGNGQLKSREEYKDGKPHGVRERYFGDGKLRSREEYKDDKRHGVWERYFGNGQLDSREEYKDGWSHGVWERYFEDGQLETRREYKDGKPHGVWESYYGSGRLRSHEEYKDGRLNGIKEWYDSDGQLTIREEYKDGFKARDLPLDSEPRFSLEDESANRLHEESRKGLRAAVGEEGYSKAMREVYTAAQETVRAEIARIAADEGYDFGRATERYLSELSEKDFGDFSESDTELWGKVRSIAEKAIASDGDAPGWATLGDNELRYMLWKGTHPETDDYVGMAEEIAKRNELGVDARFSISETEDIWNDRSLSLKERIAANAQRLADKQKDNVMLRNDARRAVVESLKDLVHEMRNKSGKSHSFKGADAKVERGGTAISGIQRRYDQSTVKRVGDLARILIQSGHITDITGGEAKRLLSVVKGAAGAEDISASVEKLTDIMVDNQLRSGKDTLESLLKVRGSKVDAKGVEVQGALDVDGQRMLTAFKTGRAMDSTELYGKDGVSGAIGRCYDRIGSANGAEAEEAVVEMRGLQLAKIYHERVKESEADERLIREDMEQTMRDWRSGKITTSQRDGILGSLTDALRNNRIERIEAYSELAQELSGDLRESVMRAADFREKEIERVRGIQHAANSDLQGRPSDEHNDVKSKAANNKIARFLLSPLGTFHEWLKLFGSSNVNGEGYLYNIFQRGWIDAAQKEKIGFRDKKRILDAKATEVFGRKMKWQDLYTYDGKLPKTKVTFWDGGEMKEHELSQGNLLYIWLVDKMADGRATNRRAGITEDDIARIDKALDPKLKRLGEWLQEEFLPKTRSEYNETHKRVFGASCGLYGGVFGVAEEPGLGVGAGGVDAVAFVEDFDGGSFHEFAGYALASQGVVDIGVVDV